MNMHQPTLTAPSLARVLGGDASGNQVSAPGPGHSASDRSMSIRVAPEHPDGFIVKSHSPKHTDLECKAYIQEKAGLPRFGGNAKRQDGGRSAPEYIYYLENDSPYLKVVRLERMDGGKKKKVFPQYHWTGSGWGKGKPKGPKIPYRLPDLLRSPNAPVLITEGEKDADNLARLGFLGTSASEGAGKWTPELGKWFKGRTVYILPDNDEAGRKHARQVAENLHGIAAEVRIVPLPGLLEAGDVSDWIAKDGDVEELMRLCEAAPVWTPHSEPSPERQPLEWVNELKPVLKSRYLIKGLLDIGAMSLVFGPPGAAKTFFVMDLAFHLAAGMLWRGRRVRRAAVLYLAAEGGSGVVNRLVALKTIHNAHDVPFAIRRAGLDLMGEDADLEMVCALAKQVQARCPGLPLLVVVDTLSRAMAGGDENAAGDMTALIRNLDAIRDETGAHVLAVHHAGKDTTRGARGHSSLKGATDTEIELRTVGNLRVARVSKQRDNPGEETFAFTLRSHLLGVDEDGDPVTSCTVEEAEAEEQTATQSAKGRGKNQQLIMETFDQMVAEGLARPTPGGVGMPEPGQFWAVEVAELRRLAQGKMASKDAAKLFRTAWKSLTDPVGLFVTGEDLAWRVDRRRKHYAAGA